MPTPSQMNSIKPQQPIESVSPYVDEFGAHKMHSNPFEMNGVYDTDEYGNGIDDDVDTVRESTPTSSINIRIELNNDDMMIIDAKSG